jgi:hypothetical protein
VDKREIIALLEAVCDRPLAAGPQEPADLQAFCRDAVEALAQAGDAETAADADRLTAALAAVLSGTDSEEARRTVEEAVLRSPAARLDAQSALAFIDALEETPQAAPAELVAELLAVDRAVAAHAAAAPAAGAGLWSRIAGAPWPARRWQLAAACAVLLIGGTASWWAYAPQRQPDRVAAPVKGRGEEPAVAAGAPEPARSAAAQARISPCEPRVQAGAAAPGQGDAPAASPPPAESAADAACASDPRLADRPPDELEQLLARQRLEAARQAAERDAAAKAGAAQADRSGGVFDTLGRHPPAAATRSAPAMAPAAPAARPAAPYGIR